jgi:hypothetical protein
MAESNETPRDDESEKRAENSIGKSKRRRLEVPPPLPPVEAGKGSSKPTDTASIAEAVPEAVRSRFLQVSNRYYFPDGVRAFTDRGDRLTTPSENTEVIRSLVAIAKAREWTEITVRGTERFRKQAWLEASLAGLEVRGFRPSEVEEAHLVRAQRGNSVAAGSDPISTAREPDDEEEPPRSSAKQDAFLTGRMVDFGRATYRHDPRAPMSYFVKLETSRGDRTIWGVDLERALRESLTKPQIGDEVALQSVRQDAVTVKAPTRDSEGRVVGEEDLATHRNRWVLERRGFFESRANAASALRDIAADPKQAVKQHPELVGSYLQMHAAELFAERLANSEDRQRFLGIVRSTLADSVARGEPLPAVRLHERPPERTREAREPEQAQVRG